MSRVPIIHYDLLPTLLDALGGLAELPDAAEGGSLLPVMKRGGKGRVQRRNPYFVFHYSKGPKDVAIVQDDFKLLKELKHDRPHLWNLRQDLGEQQNLAVRLPDKTSAMEQTLTRYLDKVDAPAAPQVEPESSR